MPSCSVSTLFSRIVLFESNFQRQTKFSCRGAIKNTFASAFCIFLHFTSYREGVRLVSRNGNQLQSIIASNRGFIVKY